MENETKPSLKKGRPTEQLNLEQQMHEQTIRKFCVQKVFERMPWGADSIQYMADLSLAIEMTDVLYDYISEGKISTDLITKTTK